MIIYKLHYYKNALSKSIGKERFSILFYPGYVIICVAESLSNLNSSFSIKSLNSLHTELISVVRLLVNIS